MIEAVEKLAKSIGVSAACQALGVPRSSLYRARQPEKEPRARPTPERALSEEEKVQVRQVLNSERFQDCSPRQVYATLLDERVYLCHWRTMYRILAEHEEVRERRNQQPGSSQITQRAGSKWRLTAPDDALNLEISVPPGQFAISGMLAGLGGQTWMGEAVGIDVTGSVLGTPIRSVKVALAESTVEFQPIFMPAVFKGVP